MNKFFFVPGCKLGFYFFQSGIFTLESIGTDLVLKKASEPHVGGN